MSMEKSPRRSEGWMSGVSPAFPLLCAFLALVAAAYIAGADVAAAQGFHPLAPAPETSKLGQLYGSIGLADFLSKLFSAAISIGAILAVLRLAYAGYVYMTSDAWSDKGHAREVIGDVVLGLLLLLSVWLILNQINPQILSLDVLRGARELPAAPPQQQNSTAPSGQSTSGGFTGDELGPQAP